MKRKPIVLKCGLDRNDVVDLSLSPWVGFVYFRHAVATPEQSAYSSDFKCIFLISHDSTITRDYNVYVLDDVRINDGSYNDYHKK